MSNGDPARVVAPATLWLAVALTGAACVEPKSATVDAGVTPDGAESADVENTPDGPIDSPGRNDGPVTACADRKPTAAWTLSPDIPVVMGTVTGKASLSDGSERIEFADEGGAPCRLTLELGMPSVLAVGDLIDVKVAAYSSFQIYRTLEVRRAGEPVVYVTRIVHPQLPPPPLTLEVDEQVCTSNEVPVPLGIHKLRAADQSGPPVVIGVGQQAQVGRFRVLNDFVQTNPPGTLDAMDLVQVAVVRSP